VKIGLESNLNSYLLSFNKSGGYLNSFSASFIFKWTAFLLKGWMKWWTKKNKHLSLPSPGLHLIGFQDTKDTKTHCGKTNCLISWIIWVSLLVPPLVLFFSPFLHHSVRNSSARVCGLIRIKQVLQLNPTDDPFYKHDIFCFNRTLNAFGITDPSSMRDLPHISDLVKRPRFFSPCTWMVSYACGRISLTPVVNFSLYQVLVYSRDSFFFPCERQFDYYSRNFHLIFLFVKIIDNTKYICWKKTSAKKAWGLFPRSRTSYFRVPFLIFVPSLLERFSNEYRKTKTRVITLANHNKHK